MKRILIAAFAMCTVAISLALLATTLLVQAEPAPPSPDYQRKSNIYDKTIYRFDDRIVTNDLINGDLYCLGSTIIIDAVVNGDVLCAGSSVTIKGTVEGSARIMAQDITISGNIGSNATLIASNVIVAKTATISNDVSIVAQSIAIDGEIGRDVTARSDTVTISGRIGRSIESYNYTMNVTATAIIGDISYSSPNDIVFEDGAQYGHITQIETSAPSYMSSFATGTVFLAALLYIAWFISLIITALGIAFLFPKSLEDSAMYAKNEPIITGLAGLLTITVTPFALVLLTISIVGIPLAVIIGLQFAVILLLSTPFVAHLIGTELFPQRSHPIRSLVCAVLLLLLYVIPIINIVTFLVVTTYGTGLVIRIILQRYSVAALNYKKASARK